MRARKEKVGEFKLWIGAGHVNAKCKECGVTPSLEYLGLDPIFPEFKLICSNCGTYDVMKIYLSCTKLYPIPYKGRKRFASQFGGVLGGVLPEMPKASKQPLRGRGA